MTTAARAVSVRGAAPGCQFEQLGDQAIVLADVLAHLAIEETAVFADALSPSLLIHLLKAEGGAAE